MKTKTGILIITIILIGVLTMSMMYSKIKDNDYNIAIKIAEKKFISFNINRNDFKLIKIENDIIKNADDWKLTYLDKNCISKDGLRNFKGGEVFIIVNIKKEEAIIRWGE